MTKNSILNSVFSDIEKLASVEEYKRIIKLVDKRKFKNQNKPDFQKLSLDCIIVVLDIHQFPEELSLFQSKVVSLIQLNQIEDAYNYILKNDASQ